VNEWTVRNWISWKCDDSTSRFRSADFVSRNSKISNPTLSERNGAVVAPNFFDEIRNATERKSSVGDHVVHLFSSISFCVRRRRLKKDAGASL
jgi:hypothetical protein